MTHPPILYRFTTFPPVFLPFYPFLYFLRVQRGCVSFILCNFATDNVGVGPVPARMSKHRWNPEAEHTVCKDSRRERTFSERYLSV